MTEPDTQSDGPEAVPPAMPPAVLGSIPQGAADSSLSAPGAAEPPAERRVEVPGPPMWSSWK